MTAAALAEGEHVLIEFSIVTGLHHEQLGIELMQTTVSGLVSSCGWEVGMLPCRMDGARVLHGACNSSSFPCEMNKRL